MNYDIFPDKHYILKATPDVIAICEPLFRETEITYFLFGRAYDDGSIYLLTNFPEASQNHFRNEYAIMPPIDEKFITEKFYQVVRVNELNGKYNQAIDDMRNLFNIDNMLSLIERDYGYYDIFFFGSTPTNYSIINYYINNREGLEKFTVSFKEKATKLIRNLEKNKILLPLHMRSNLKGLLGSADDKKLALMNRSAPRHYFLQHNKRNIKITSREAVCLQYLTRGYSAKELARILLISHRTVESYINNIKLKVDCYKRSDLINFALQNKLILDGTLPAKK